MAEVTCKLCGYVCKNLSGWKSHMSRTHGGYEDTDLAAVAGVGTGEGDVRSRMENFASTMPGTGGDAVKTAETGATAHRVPTDPAPTVDAKLERRVRATPKKLKKILGGIPAKILEQTGVQLDSEDTEALDEAGEFLGDIFGFEFSVPESKVLVQSRWWAVLWVAGVAGLVYIKHRFPEVFAAVFKAMKKNKGIDGEKEEYNPDSGASDRT